MSHMNDWVAVYQSQLEQGDIKKAYVALLKYVMRLKAHFSSQLAEDFSCGNVSQGYMDFTYFPFFNAFLRAQKLRFGLVLNHQKMQFELWLMGQDAPTQKKYWDALKNSRWNRERTQMPQYAVLEAVLVETPDFADLEALTLQIEKTTILVCAELMDHLKRLKNS